MAKPQKKVLLFSGQSTKAFSQPHLGLVVKRAATKKKLKKVLFSLVDIPLPPPPS